MSGGADVYLYSGQQFARILVYEPGPEQSPPPNTCANTIAGHGVTSLLGIFYLPAASVTITGSSGYMATIAGGVIAVGMVLWKKSWNQHQNQFWTILHEIATVKDPEKLTAIAAERKPQMFLLPYGIPIAIGTIAYFAWSGLLT